MPPVPTLRLLESVDDDATELTATDMASAVVVVSEYTEDDETMVSVASAPPPAQRPRPAMVSIPTEAPGVPDPAAIWNGDPSSDRPTPALELLVLQQDNVRLLRENARYQSLLTELRHELEQARAAASAASVQAAHSQQAEAQAHLALTKLTRERDHYRGFAESSLWRRIRGCSHQHASGSASRPSAARA